MHDDACINDSNSQQMLLSKLDFLTMITYGLFLVFLASKSDLVWELCIIQNMRKT
jgi:hypothetical protein